MPYAYVAAQGDDALTIINVTNPYAPTFEGSVQKSVPPESLDSCYNVFVLGNYAYLNSYNDNSITIVDITDRTNPTLVGSLAGGGVPNFLLRAEDVFVVGNLAYAIGSNDDSITIIDVTNPALPVLVGNIRGAGAPPGGNWLGRPDKLYVVGNYVYVAAAADDAFTIINVTNPAIPVFAGSIQGAGAPNFLNLATGVFVLGNYAYVVSALDDALSIFDITNPALPVLVGSIQGAGAPPGGNWLNAARNVFVRGNYAYVAASADNSLTIIDVTNPALPVLVGNIRGAGAPPGGNWLSNAYDVFILGNYAYVAAQGNSALTIIDVTNPAAPTFVGSIQGAGAPNFLSLARGVKVPLSTPADQTDSATGVTGSEAQLNGTLLDDGGEACDCGFEWGETVAYGNTTPTQSRTTGQTFSQLIAALTPGTVYHFRAFATNSVGTSYGADRFFCTLGVPTVTTDPATALGAATATPNGTLDADGGEACDCGFQWGVMVPPGNVTPLSSKTTGQTFTEVIGGLNPNSTYFFRAVATNSHGTAYGAIRTFTTAGVLPTVTTNPATGTSIINGALTVDGGEVCTCGFEWGLTAAYGNITPTLSRIAGQTFSQILGSLLPATTYHFRAFAINSVGIGYGADRTLTTLLGLPNVTTDQETGLGLLVVNFNGTLNDDGGEVCGCGFVWGNETDYTATTPTESKVTGETFSQPIRALFPDTEYHYRAFAPNSAGIAYGADRSFRSKPAVSRSYALSRSEL